MPNSTDRDYHNKDFLIEAAKSFEGKLTVACLDDEINRDAYRVTNICKGQLVIKNCSIDPVSVYFML